MAHEVLAGLIEEFRGELATELPLELHEWVGDFGGSSGLAIGWTGLPFTRPFERYIGHPDQYGYEFIAALSFDEIATHCRIHHDESHSAGGPTASLCKRLAVAVVELRQPIGHVAAQEGIGTYHAIEYLQAALTHAKAWREDMRKQVAESDTQDETREEPRTVSEMLRIQHDEERERKVWERLRARHRNRDGDPLLPEWAVERERRLVEHRKLGCADCMSIAA